MADQTVDNGTIPPGKPVVVGGSSGTNNLYLGATVTNQGTIELAGSGNVVIGVPTSTSADTDNNVVLTGGGTVVGDHVAGNNIGTVSTGGYYGNFAGTLDNINNVIKGSLTFDSTGSGGLVYQVINESGGTINASGTTNPMIFGASGLTNKGLIEDTGMAGLALEGQGVVDQTSGGTLQAVGAGAHVDLANITVAGGTLTTSAGGVIQVDPNAPGVYGFNELDGSKSALTLTAGSTVDVLSNATLDVASTLINQGTISLTGTPAAGGSALQLAGATTFRGGGTISLGNNNLINANGAQALDNVDNTIAGSGTIAGGFGFTNEAGGTIDATGQQLLIRSNIANSGLLESTSGPLNVQANITQSGGGTIAANGAASEVVLYNNTVTGGTLTSFAGGLIDIGSQGNETLAGNATLTSSANVLVENGANLYVTQSAALGGALNIGGNANGGDVYIDGVSKATQAVNSLSGTGAVVAYDSANPAQPQTVTLTVGSDGSSSSFAGLITQQSSASLALVKAGAGTFTLSAADTYAGGTTIAAGVLDLGAANAAGTAAITFAGSNTAEATLKLEAAAQPGISGTFSNTLANFGNDDAIDLAGFANGIVVYNPIVSPGTLTVSNGTQNESFSLVNPGSLAFIAQSDGSGGTLISDGVSPVCFVQGTKIRTVEGDISVERLRQGDVALTASGARRKIRWIGHRAVDCRLHPRTTEVTPVQISAHAFGEGRPMRDLLLSPGHAICVDAVGEVLIPAGALVNGSTIVQAKADSVTYWHVELEGGHDILLAENLPCESYLEMGNRGFFIESGIVALDASPDPHAVSHADFCRPFHGDGPVVSFVRERLAARAPDLGWTFEHAPFANLHLVVNGRCIGPVVDGLAARFLVPADAKDVWLISDVSVPAELGMVPDTRRLGICVGSLVIDDGFGTPRTFFADHPLLGVGFHDIEEGPQRWTAGRARVPAEFWNAVQGSFFLRVELTRPALPKWIAPISRVWEDDICISRR